MKRLLYAAALLSAITAASAQDYWSTPVGLINDGKSRELKLTPRSAIDVELTIREEQFTAGIYARYAQKYLGVRASLADRKSYSVVDSSIAMAPREHFIASGEHLLSQPSTEQPGTLSVDVTSSQVPALEQAAERAAAAIFKIRQTRLDLMSGDVGEGVFGAGLGATIEKFDQMEREYIEMFMGKSSSSERSYKFTLYPQSDVKEYLFARFSADRGLLPMSDLTGEPVYVQITPSEGEKFGGTFDESLPPLKDHEVITFAVANPSACVLSVGSEVVASIRMPLYEFGQQVKYSVIKR